MQIIKKEYDTEHLCEWVIKYHNKLLYIPFGIFNNVIEEAKQRIHPVDLSFDEPAIVEYYILLTDEVWIWDETDGDLIEKYDLNEKEYKEITNWLYDQKIG